MSKTYTENWLTAIKTIRFKQMLCGMLMFALVLGSNPGQAQVNGIYPPDDRVLISKDEMVKYPFKMIGRIENENGMYCTAVLVGPRHVLTAAHCIPWKPNGGIGWIKFTPAYYGGEAPFGSANAKRVFYYKTPWIPDFGPAIDMAVIVLDEKLGDKVGWMGSRRFSTSQTGDAFLTHAGYPGDLGGGELPYKVTSCSFNAWLDASLIFRDLLLLGTYCDITSGHSGGPFFAEWSGGICKICVVGVLSAGFKKILDYYGINLPGNIAMGGDLLNALIRDARNAYP